MSIIDFKNNKPTSTKITKTVIKTSIRDSNYDNTHNVAMAYDPNRQPRREYIEIPVPSLSIGDTVSVKVSRVEDGLTFVGVGTGVVVGIKSFNGDYRYTVRVNGSESNYSSIDLTLQSKGEIISYEVTYVL